MANAFNPDFDEGRDEPGWSMRRARIGRQAGAERLGASLYELPPGQAAWPYHAHFGNEELLVVLRGAPELRSPSGVRELAEGEVVAFPVGPDGAHQIVNRGSSPVRFLIVSEMNAPEVVVYPDSGKVSARGQPPGAGGQAWTFREADGVDYWADERPPGR